MECTDRKRQQTRLEIIEAARHVLERESIRTIGLRQVADQLGVTRQALYYYFPSKEKLVLESCSTP